MLEPDNTIDTIHGLSPQFGFQGFRMISLQVNFLVLERVLTMLKASLQIMQFSTWASGIHSSFLGAIAGGK